MGNYAWLRTCDDPSGQSADHRTVAAHKWGVPILWNVLFVVNDVVETEVRHDDGLEREMSLVARKDEAIARLDQRQAWLSKCFEKERPLDAHAAFLARALTESSGEFVAVHLAEIASMTDARRYHAIYVESLARFTMVDAKPGFLDRLLARPKAADPTLRRWLLDVSGYKRGRPFPPADLLIGTKGADADDEWNLAALLGAAWEAPVPWCD